MSELFEQIKSSISLEDHITGKTAAQIMSGGKTCHVNPCPLCDHRDCFTLYRDTNSFKCFSCDKAGDIINFERLRLGLDANIDAARALADQYGIDGGTGEPGKTYTPKPRPEPAPPVVDHTLTIPEECAHNLRALAAEYFHDLLMRNAQALQYQTGHRGHALSTLQSRKIGWSDGDLPKFLAHITAQGYTEADAVAVGLIGNTKKDGTACKPWLKLNHGLFVYPHYYKGEVVHFTTKDPNPDKAARKKWQLGRACGDPSWLCYNQDILHNDIIILVEGEDDALTCIENGAPNTIAVIGNANTRYLTYWFENNAKDKTAIMAFDPDQAGRKYFKRYTEAIYKGGGRVLSIMAPLSRAGKDIDDYLRASEDPAAALASMLQKATRASRPRPKALPDAPPVGAGHARETEPDPTPDAPIENQQSTITNPPVTILPAYQPGYMEPYGFDTFEVLGEDEAHKISIWSSRNNRTYNLKLKDLNYDQLVQFGGPAILERVSRKATEGMIMFATLKGDIICTASRRQLSTLRKLGQGIHLLSTGSLLIVSGDTAYIWDGGTLTQHSHPFLDGKRIEGDPNGGWIKIDDLKTELAKMNQPRALAIRKRLVEQLSQWGFAGKMDTYILTGWLLAQIVQAAWVWRPHLWVTGSAGTGKSLLTQWVETVFDNFKFLAQGQRLSEPALRQNLNLNSVPTIIDEFEQNSGDRENIIELLRSAGRGGMIPKGSPNGEAPVSYYIRHMVMLLSVETGIDKASEKTRYLVINTEKDQSKSPQIPDFDVSEKIKTAMIAYSLWGYREAMALIKNHGPVEGIENRWIDTVAMPLSMIAISTPEPMTTLREMVAKYIDDYDMRAGGTSQTDEISLLKDIMMIRVRVQDYSGATDTQDGKIVYVDRTLGMLLEYNPIPAEIDKTMQGYGVRRIDNGKNAGLFLRAETVSASLATTAPKWKGLKIKELLLRLPGAKRLHYRIGGASQDGVLIPHDVWDPYDEEDPVTISIP